jgi:hypothetical protein
VGAPCAFLDSLEDTGVTPSLWAIAKMDQFALFHVLSAMNAGVRVLHVLVLLGLGADGRFALLVLKRGSRVCSNFRSNATKVWCCELGSHIIWPRRKQLPQSPLGLAKTGLYCEGSICSSWPSGIPLSPEWHFSNARSVTTPEVSSNVTTLTDLPQSRHRAFVVKSVDMSYSLQTHTLSV